MQKPRRSGTPCRLEHHGLTSHEVSMQKPKRSGTPCRLEHHGPTSSEVSMRNSLRGNERAACAPCRLQHQRPTSYEVGMRGRSDTHSAKTFPLTIYRKGTYDALL